MLTEIELRINRQLIRDDLAVPGRAPIERPMATSNPMPSASTASETTAEGDGDNAGKRKLFRLRRPISARLSRLGSKR